MTELKSSSSTESEACPEVAIIVLNWNNYSDTAECLRSLKDIEYPNYCVYVVDNGSTDGSGERLEEEFPWCEFIFNHGNLGFAAGNNPAIDTAIEGEASYVLLLNNDIQAEDGLLKPLVETAEKYEDTVIVGGVLLNEEGDVYSAGGDFNQITTRLKIDEEVDSSEFRTNFVSGAMLLADSNFLKSVGGLSEYYFFGMEDQELAWKAKKEGKELRINSRSRAVHKIGGSSDRESPFRFYHATRNRLEFIRRNLFLPNRIIAYLFFIITRVVRFIQWFFQGKTSKIKAVLLGMYDWILREPFRRVSDF
ncbi:glycosyltransferase family 2 protein [Halorubrum sp. CGM5_25_10-8B]|uniref:glycosyltransferase family 2 protein n=1 Tax=Halorubrum sp. CGM5_25_10-8B TaxID=2518115 RepID=UPI00130E8B36|nr:glycosyltransferase family 2 protein [Halorubrum sp. CGM5_25_10-8B]